MYSDDVFRSRLEQVIDDLERWGAETRDCADIKITAAPGYYWKLRAEPLMAGACPFEILLLSSPHFSLDLAGETYEDKPLDRFDFFLMLARAIEAGHVDRIETRSALTGALEAIESRVELEDGWAWIGERRIGGRTSRKIEGAQEVRARRFLPYRR